MKKLFTLLACVIFISNVNAQQINQLYECGPDYPIPYLSSVLDSSQISGNQLINTRGMGLVLHDNLIKIWRVMNDTVHIFSLDSTSYQESSILGSGYVPNDSLGLNFSGYLFNLNGLLYNGDESGIRKEGTNEYWPYSFNNEYIRTALIEQNVVWLFSNDWYGNSTTVTKFDGVNISFYNDSIWAGTQTWDGEIFSIGDSIYFTSLGYNIPIIYLFNKVNGAFSVLHSDSFPNYQMYAKSIAKSVNGNLLVLGYDINYNFMTQELINGSWSNPIYFSNVAKSSIYITSNLTLFSLNSGIMIDHENVDENLFFKPINSEYELVYTIHDDPFGIHTRDQDGNIYYLTANTDPSCGNTNAVYNKILIDASLDHAEGVTYVDENLNNLFDGTDYPVSNKSVCNLLSNCHFTNSDGEYYLYLYPDANELTAQSINYFTTPASIILNNVDSSYANLNFGYKADTIINDFAAASVFSLQPPRPGFDITYNLLVENIGTVPLSDTLVYTYDSLFTFLSATPSPLYQIGNSVAWLTGNINPLLSASFSVTLNLTDTAALGTIVSSNSYVDVINEGNASNNFYTLTQTVGGAWDPNDKTPNPPYWVQDGERIQYTIRFQNTGTDTAFNIVVRDTLDSNLEWESFEMLYASHLVDAELNQQNGALAFRFNNILLPDSNINEPGSHGTIVYTIKTQNGLVDGTPINNTASIYFDYNQPVVTNTTLNVIGDGLGVESLSTKHNLFVYPNPTNGKLRVQWTQGMNATQWQINDVLGKELQRGNILTSTNATDINLQELPSGIYNLSLSDAKGNVIGRSKVSVVH